MGVTGKNLLETAVDVGLAHVDQVAKMDWLAVQNGPSGQAKVDWLEVGVTRSDVGVARNELGVATSGPAHSGCGRKSEHGCSVGG